jgi:hypothetical protein
MKFCYCDESGTGNEPVATMVGVVADTYRMHLTKEDWAVLLDELSGVVGRQLAELHASDFYSGNGVFRKIDGAQRRAVISAIFKWFRARSHQLVYASVVKADYYAALKAGAVPDELNTPWRFMGFHLVLSIQKRMQREDKPKGHTVFVFDNAEREKMRFADLIARPPAWSDEYYDREPKQKQLDQVIDTPYFGDSKEVSLIQFADLAAFFLRRYAELKHGLVGPEYDDEEQRVAEWVTGLAESSIDRPCMYLKVGRGKAAALFHDLAPVAVREL